MKRNKCLYYIIVSFLFIFKFMIPSKALAQSPIDVIGDYTACVGDIKTYTPGVSNSGYTYHWSVLPSGVGTVLSGNHIGATVQWMAAGGADVLLIITDPLNANDTLYQGGLGITVSSMPAPYITSNVELGCQPLNEDTLKRDKPTDNIPEFEPTNCQLVCEQSTVQYTANGDYGSTFTWVIIGAVSYTPVTGPVCDVTWGVPGFGEVRLIETSAYGCVTETSICIEVIEGPQAKFETLPVGLPDPIEICRYGELVLQDFSTASASSPIVSYLWDWGDGHITPMSPGAAGSSVSHIYEDPGHYSVTLTVINSCGCASTYSRKVHVKDEKGPKIACPRVVCEGEKATYSIDPSFRCSPDSWSVIGGEIVYADPVRLEVIWNNVDPNTGFGYVMYESCDPCRMVVVEPVPVILKSGIIQGPSVICEKQQTVFRMPKWPATEFNWYVSGPAIIQPTDQRNEIAVTAMGSGTITLGVKYFNTVLGCGGSSQINIQVLPQEIINGPQQLCQGSFASFMLSGGYSGNWTLSTAMGIFVSSASGSNFPYTFDIPGSYRLSVIGADFCPPEDYLIKVIATPEPPDIITGPERACPGIPIRFDAGNPIAGTTFEWSVGGMGSGTVSANMGDFSYVTFASLPADVIVRRITTDGLACASDYVHYTVDVAVPPLSISGSDTVCHSTIENYAINYLEGDHYEWEISDPLLGSVVANANTPHPDIQWNIPSGSGTTVTLIAKVKKCNETNTSYFNVFVRGIPAITGIVVNPDETVCSGTPVTLTVNTSIPVSSATYIVNWGDATIDGLLNHTYTTTGLSTPMAFTPNVTLVNANGCLGAVSANAPTITVKPAPVAVLSPGGIIAHCGSFSAETLITTVTTGIGGSEDYVWNTPSGLSNPGNTPINNVASEYGNYSVTVTNSVSGCSSTSNIVRIIEDCGSGPGTSCGTPPVVILSADTAHCGIIQVTATGPGVPGDWILPIGVSYSSTSPSSPTILNATATAAGVYTIRYRVSYPPTGCYATYSINVVVPYIPDLKYDISCNQIGNDYKITLFDHSTEFPLTPITNMDYYRLPSWTYVGSGMSANAFQSGGDTVTYAEVIRSGTISACTSYVTVITPDFPSVNVWLGSDVIHPGCVNDVIFDFYHNESGTINSHLWDFESGSTNASDIIPIGKVYSTFGLKLVSLTVTDLYGCYAIDYVTVEVETNPYQGDLNANPNPACQGTAVSLNYTPIASTTLPNSFIWYEQSNPIISTTAPFYNVFTPGGYWVEGIGLYGCKVQTDIVPVDVIQVPAISIMGNAGACVDQAFTLTTQDYGAGYLYSWSGAASGSGSSLTQTISGPGTYTYYVTITETISGYNCTQISAPFTVTISAPPSPPSLYFNITSCEPYEVELNAVGVPGVYNWSNGMTGTSIHTPFGGDYQVTLTDLNGCVVQNSIAVPKSLEEYMWVFPTGCFCRQHEAYVIGPIIPLNYWEWQRDGGVDAAGAWYMPPYWINPGHTYNMHLNNGWCSLTSGDMYYMSDTCERLAKEWAGEVRMLPFGQNNLEVNTLEVSPNPAGDYANVHFQYASGSESRSIELIDVTGRKLQSYVPDGDQGSIRLSLDGYASGMYNVIMRRNGIVVQTRKLSVTK